MFYHFRAGLRLTILNTLFKLITFFTILALMDLIVPSLYTSYSPVILTTLVLTAVGTVADLVIVPRYGNLPSLLMGFPAMALIIWFIPRFWPYSNLTLGWAAVLAIFLGPFEYLLHEMVLRSLDQAD